MPCRIRAQQVNTMPQRMLLGVIEGMVLLLVMRKSPAGAEAHMFHLLGSVVSARQNIAEMSKTATATVCRQVATAATCSIRRKALNTEMVEEISTCTATTTLTTSGIVAVRAAAGNLTHTWITVNLLAHGELAMTTTQVIGNAVEVTVLLADTEAHKEAIIGAAIMIAGIHTVTTTGAVIDR